MVKSFNDNKGLKFEQMHGMLEQMGKLTIFPYVTENVEEFKLKMYEYRAAGIWDDYYLDTTIKGGSVSDRAPHELIAKSIFNCQDVDIINNSFKRFEFEYRYDDHQIKQYFNVYIVSRENGKIFKNRYILLPKTNNISLSRDDDSSEIAINILKNNKSYMTAETIRYFGVISANDFNESQEGELYKTMTGRIYQEDIDIEMEKVKIKKEKQTEVPVVKTEEIIKKEIIIETPIVKEEVVEETKEESTTSESELKIVELKPETIEEPELKEGDLKVFKATKEEEKRIEELKTKVYSFEEMKKYIIERYSSGMNKDDIVLDLLEEYTEDSELSSFELLDHDQVKTIFDYMMKK